MPTPAEIKSAFITVRADVDKEAGWYAHMISDDMITRLVTLALAAAEKVRAKP